LPPVFTQLDICKPKYSSAYRIKTKDIFVGKKKSKRRKKQLGWKSNSPRKVWTVVTIFRGLRPMYFKKKLL